MPAKPGDNPRTTDPSVETASQLVTWADELRQRVEAALEAGRRTGAGTRPPFDDFHVQVRRVLTVGLINLRSPAAGFIDDRVAEYEAGSPRATLSGRSNRYGQTSLGHHLRDDHR